MRHRVYGKQLGRNKNGRGRLFKGLLWQLVLHGSIQTSDAKSKAIKGLIDKAINFAKEKNYSRLQSIVTDKNLQERLVKEIAPKMEKRTSGYTSMVRLGTRLGDQTMMVRMSLLGAEQWKPLEKGLGSRVQGIVKIKEQKKTIPAKKITPKKSVARKRVVNKK